MPQIPLTEGYRIAPENPGTQEEFHNIRPNTQVTENWGKVGNSLAGGLALHVGTAMAKAIDDADRTQALSLANELRRKASELSYGKEGYLSVKGQNALSGDLPATYGERLTKATEEIGKRANVRARKYFNDYAAKINSNFHDGIDRHIYRESVAVEASNQENAHNLDTQEITTTTSNKDYEGMASAIEASAEHVREFAERAGVKPDYTKVVGSQVVMAASIMMENDADWKMVKAFISGAKASGYLNASQAEHLSKTVKRYEVDKRTDELADKAFSKFAGNEAAGLKWLREHADQFPDPDDNALAQRKLAERYNSQNAVKRAGYEQSAELFHSEMVKAYKSGNLHPNPFKTRGFDGMSPQAQASEGYRWQAYQESQRKKRAGESSGNGDETTVVAFKDPKGNTIFLKKKTVKAYRDIIRAARANDDTRQIVDSWNLEEDVTSGLSHLGLPDGIPLTAIYEPVDRVKLREDQAKPFDRRVQRIRQFTEQYLTTYSKMDRDRAKLIAGYVAADAQDVFTEQGKRVISGKGFKPRTLDTDEDIEKFIQEELVRVNEKDLFFFKSGGKTLAEMNAEQRQQRRNASISGEQAEPPVEVTKVSPRSPQAVYTLANRAYQQGIRNPDTVYSAWANSVRAKLGDNATSERIAAILNPTQKAIISCQSTTSDRVMLNALPTKLMREGASLAFNEIRGNEKFRGLSDAQVLSMINEKTVVAALAKRYFTPVNAKAPVESTGAVTKPANNGGESNGD